jgi:hypothetical protein
MTATLETLRVVVLTLMSPENWIRVPQESNVSCIPVGLTSYG